MPRKLPEKILNDEEKKELLKQPNKDSPTGLRNYCMIKLMLRDGLRVSEIVNLETGHLDMMTGKLFIKESKGAKDRVVWCAEDLIDDLKEWLDVRADMINDGDTPDPVELQRQENVPEKEIKDYFFITFNGTPVKNRYIRKMVKRYAKKTDMNDGEKVHPHTLRHTFATDYLEHTGNIKKVQKALGHSQQQTTDIYLHLSDEDLEEGMKTLGMTGEDD